MNVLWSKISSMVTKTLSVSNSINTTIPSVITKRFFNENGYLTKLYNYNEKRKENPELFIKKKKSPLDGKPFAKGVILRTVIKKPRKPNSANRKCVLVKLSTGKEMLAYVPGVGHLLQEHQVVLCKVDKLKDVPGVKLSCVRGKYDLPHSKKKKKRD